MLQLQVYCWQPWLAPCSAPTHKRCPCLPVSADFKHGWASHKGRRPCCLTELCCALAGDAWADGASAPGATRRRTWLDAPLLLLPVAQEGEGHGSIEEQLRRYHASLAQALLDEALFPMLPAEVPPEWFRQPPLGLEAAALSAADIHGEEPVLAALRSHDAHRCAVAVPATTTAEECMAGLAL